MSLPPTEPSHPECGICEYEYSAPDRLPFVILPCLHGYCKVCLDALPTKECPTCRERIEKIVRNFDFCKALEARVEEEASAEKDRSPEIAGKKVEPSSKDPLDKTLVQALLEENRRLAERLDERTGATRPEKPVYDPKKFDAVKDADGELAKRLQAEERELADLNYAKQLAEREKRLAREGESGGAHVVSRMAPAAVRPVKKEKWDGRNATHELCRLAALELQNLLDDSKLEMMKPHFSDTLHRQWATIMWHSPSQHVDKILQDLYQFAQLPSFLNALASLFDQHPNFEKAYNIVLAHKTAELFLPKDTHT